jgi:hypothetical protein
MNFSPPCTQDQIDAGSCGFLCPTGDCFVPMQADDPASRLFQLKEGLYNSLASRGDDLLLGFASLNQDALNVRAKHWIYQATSNGPVVPGGPSFPATGAQEVFGYSWVCNTGSGNGQTGCSASLPARLNVPWEVTRVQRLPKGGLQFNQAVDVYIRPAGSGTNYKVHYVPAGAAGLGASGITTTVSLFKCSNIPCSSTTLIGTQSVSWQLVGEFLSWDNGGSSSLSQVNPELSYFFPDGRRRHHDEQYLLGLGSQHRYDRRPHQLVERLHPAMAHDELGPAGLALLCGRRRPARLDQLPQGRARTAPRPEPGAQPAGDA